MILKQIKIFDVSEYGTSEQLEIAVNSFIIDVFENFGNFASIETNSKFISVVFEKSVKCDRNVIKK
jgi:hypothetical protein